MNKIKQLLHRFTERLRAYRVTFLLALFGIMFIISAYLLSPLNQIKQINVVGNTHLPQKLAIEGAALQEGMPLWETWLDRSYHENNLTNAYEQVANANIEFADWQALTINVDEYKLVAQMENENGQNIVFLENQTSFVNDYTTVTTVPFLMHFEGHEDVRDELIEGLTDVNEDVLGMMSEIEFLDVSRNPKLLRVNMNDGSQVLINSLNFANRINYYPLYKDAVDNQIGLYDLEAGTFFTPFTEESQLDNTAVEDANEAAAQEAPVEPEAIDESAANEASTENVVDEETNGVE